MNHHILIFNMYSRSYIESHKGHPHYVTNRTIKSLQKNYGDIDSQSDLVEVLRNLSDPTKLKIYLLLHKVEEIPVTDIVNVLGISQSVASHALADLKDLDLVEGTRCGQLMCYSLKRQPKKRNNLLSVIEKFFN